MSIEVKDTVGKVTVTVDWNVQKEEPELGVDIQVLSEVFPVDDCLRSLAAACRRAADELDKQREGMAGQANPPITDGEY